MAPLSLAANESALELAQFGSFGDDWILGRKRQKAPQGEKNAGKEH
jgi:hypothetical protein